MVHSVELVFDQDTETAIRQVWDRLADAGVPSQAPASRPHATLVVAEQIEQDVDELLAPLVARFPFACRLGAPLLFGRSAPVLARLVVPSTDLLEVHAEVYRRCASYLLPEPMPRSEPGQWTPHVTLARRVAAPRLGRALRIVGRPSEIAGSVVGLRRWDGNKRAEHPIGRRT